MNDRPGGCSIPGNRVKAARHRFSGKSITIDGATAVLEGGEKLGIAVPFGCRMGTCQFCVVSLESGYVCDLRSGMGHGQDERNPTCISAASGDCTITI